MKLPCLNIWFIKASTETNSCQESYAELFNIAQYLIVLAEDSGGLNLGLLLDKRMLCH